MGWPSLSRDRGYPYFKATVQPSAQVILMSRDIFTFGRSPERPKTKAQFSSEKLGPWFPLNPLHGQNPCFEVFRKMFSVKSENNLDLSPSYVKHYMHYT